MSPQVKQTRLQELHSRLASARAEFDRLRLEYADKAIQLTAQIAAIEAEAQDLLNSVRVSSIGTVTTRKSRPRQAPQRAEPRRSGRPATSAFAKAVGNVREWAEKRGLSPNTAKKWTVKGKNGARVPQIVAEELKRTHGVPISSWPNGTY